jgi:uncharacterized protein (DUF885 family)
MTRAAAICLCASLFACASGSSSLRLREIEREYVVGFLHRNPVVSTYLGGVGLDPQLALEDGRLRDWSARALEEEDRWLETIDRALASIDPETLSSGERIDREVARAQIAFQLRQHRVRRHQERAIDTYMDEAFRGADWQIQGMTPEGDRLGTTAEWTRMAERVEAVPAYLDRAKEELLLGVSRNNLPDVRLIERDGIESVGSAAKYFEVDLPGRAEKNLPAAPALVERIRLAGKSAARAYEGFGEFLKQTYSGLPKVDRFSMGEAEYDWALENNLRVKVKAAELFESSWPIVEKTRRELGDLAREIAKARGVELPEDDAQAVRKIRDVLEEDHPKSDEELFAWYRAAAVRMVEYARKTGLFDVPDAYALDIVETPEPLRGGGPGAAYYPAPPFKGTGVGCFYLTPTGDDPEELAHEARAAVADLAAHEGFPGHDWNYKVMTKYRDEISPVRWITPGAVEDSSSMWQDSMAAEGWGLYAESLMAEPAPGAPEGFYSREERLYVLRGRLFRELRVRLDTGLHTGRLTFDEAVDLYSTVMHGRPGSCKDPQDAAKKASCSGAGHEIHRYAKWPTQAVAYRLGKDALHELRERASRELGQKFDLKAFHLAFMKRGSIPPGYFADELIRELASSAGVVGGDRGD